MLPNPPAKMSPSKSKQLGPPVSHGLANPAVTDIHCNHPHAQMLASPSTFKTPACGLKPKALLRQTFSSETPLRPAASSCTPASVMPQQLHPQQAARPDTGTQYISARGASAIPLAHHAGSITTTQPQKLSEPQQFLLSLRPHQEDIMHEIAPGCLLWSYWCSIGNAAASRDITAPIVKQLLGDDILSPVQQMRRLQRHLQKLVSLGYLREHLLVSSPGTWVHRLAVKQIYGVDLSLAENVAHRLQQEQIRVFSYTQVGQPVASTRQTTGLDSNQQAVAAPPSDSMKAAAAQLAVANNLSGVRRGVKRPASYGMITSRSKVGLGPEADAGSSQPRTEVDQRAAVLNKHHQGTAAPSDATDSKSSTVAAHQVTAKTPDISGLPPTQRYLHHQLATAVSVAQRQRETAGKPADPNPPILIWKILQQLISEQTAGVVPSGVAITELVGSDDLTEQQQLQHLEQQLAALAAAGTIVKCVTTVAPGSPWHFLAARHMHGIDFTKPENRQSGLKEMQLPLVRYSLAGPGGYDIVMQSAAGEQSAGMASSQKQRVTQGDAGAAPCKYTQAEAAGCLVGMLRGRQPPAVQSPRQQEQKVNSGLQMAANSYPGHQVPDAADTRAPLTMPVAPRSMQPAASVAATAATGQAATMAMVELACAAANAATTQGSMITPAASKNSGPQATQQLMVKTLTPALGTTAVSVGAKRLHSTNKVLPAACGSPDSSSHGQSAVAETATMSYTISGKSSSWSQLPVVDKAGAKQPDSGQLSANQSYLYCGVEAAVKKAVEKHNKKPAGKGNKHSALYSWNVLKQLVRDRASGLVPTCVDIDQLIGSEGLSEPQQLTILHEQLAALVTAGAITQHTVTARPGHTRHGLAAKHAYGMDLKKLQHSAWKGAKEPLPVIAYSLAIENQQVQADRDIAAAPDPGNIPPSTAGGEKQAAVVAASMSGDLIASIAAVPAKAPSCKDTISGATATARAVPATVTVSDHNDACPAQQLKADPANSARTVRSAGPCSSINGPIKGQSTSTAVLATPTAHQRRIPQSITPDVFVFYELPAAAQVPPPWCFHKGQFEAMLASKSPWQVLERQRADLMQLCARGLLSITILAEHNSQGCYSREAVVHILPTHELLHQFSKGDRANVPDALVSNHQQFAYNAARASIFVERCAFKASGAAGQVQHNCRYRTYPGIQTLAPDPGQSSKEVRACALWCSIIGTTLWRLHHEGFVIRSGELAALQPLPTEPPLDVFAEQDRQQMRNELAQLCIEEVESSPVTLASWFA